MLWAKNLFYYFAFVFLLQQIVIAQDQVYDRRGIKSNLVENRDSILLSRFQ